MTEEEIAKNNVLIAKFLGYENWLRPTTFRIDGHPVQQWELRYHCSWDWLMKAVEKIDSAFGSVSISNNSCTFYITEKDEYLSHFIVNGYINDDYRNCNNKLETVYKAVVEFVKWYNDKNK